VSGSLNRVQVLGFLGADPEVHTTADGKRIANLRVATTDSWVDKNTGEKKSQTEWHRCTIFSDGLAGVVERFLRKGSRVYIEGQLKTRRWTNQQGIDQYSTEIVIQGLSGTLLMLDNKDDSSQSQQHGPQQAQSTPPCRASNSIQYGQPQVVHSAPAPQRGRQLPPEPDLGLQDDIVW
jgi:single-strand DNA-binding protein